MEVELLQLMLTKGIGNVSISNILDHISCHTNCSLESVCANPEQLSSIINCKSEIIENIAKNKECAKNLFTELCNKDIKVLTKYSPDFPESLKIALGKDCPAVIFVKGNIDLLSSKSVGFCGSRNVSEKGLRIAEQCAEQLVKNGITITSGYAKGTDIAAHAAAINSGGNTIFVLAEGILNYTIKQPIRNTLNKDNHIFVSQFLPNSIWSPANAMKRNSLIIGLSKAMILIESRKTGGTFAAGVETLKRNLPLFVVDYMNPSESAEANKYFINNGGNPIRRKNGVPNLDSVITISNSCTSNKACPNFYNSEQLTWAIY